MIPEWPTAAEILGGVVILVGLGLSLWSLNDDIIDLDYVREHGIVGGPRWVAATEHAWTSLSFLVGWLCILYVLGVAVYLPARGDVEQDALAASAGWARLGFTVFVLVAQVHRRIGRAKLRALPAESWEQMLLMMFDGLGPVERISLNERLLMATAAGRQMGHLIANELSPPVGLIDIVLASAVLTDQQRADLIEAREHIVAVSARAANLHAEIKAQERGGAPEGE